MVGSTKLYSIFQDSSRRSIETSFCADLSRGSNSLNSDTVLRAQFQMRNYRPCWCIFETSYLSYRNEQYVLFSVCRCVNWRVLDTHEVSVLPHPATTACTWDRSSSISGFGLETQIGRTWELISTSSAS